MGEAGRPLWDLLGSYLGAEGVELDDLEVAGSGRGRTLRVVVDRDGGVDVDRIADLSRGMSRLLDESDAVEGPYTLEVTSPGLERKLRRPEHFTKAIGRMVKVKTTAPVDGATLHEGKLDEADATGFVLQLNEERRRIGFGDVKEARTVFVWERAAKPGKRR